VLTVLGVVMMQTSRMQERMAGNTRDLNLALQGAEAGLRYGEALIASYTLATIPDQTAVMPCGICLPNVLPIAMSDRTPFGGANRAGAYGPHPPAVTPPAANLAQPNGVGLQANPQYATEYLNYVPDDLSPTSPGIDYSQVTSHSGGSSGLANVVLQS